MTRELIVDAFAGGGGASVGIEWATGRSPNLAINHDPLAVAVHRANHPATQHYTEDVWAVDPTVACAGQPVGLLWLSPDCRHFSRAKGAAPVAKRVRSLAWLAVRWAFRKAPRILILENVEEFTTWGPLGADGRPDPAHRGETFRAFVGALSTGCEPPPPAVCEEWREVLPDVPMGALRHGLGYRVEWRVLRACDYGAPTSRARLVLIARRDDAPIAWPTPLTTPQATAGSCIDWSVPCPSIFGRARPLCANTMRRIAQGVQRFVCDAARVPVVRGPDTAHAPVVAAFLSKYYGDRGQRPGSALDEPIGTVTAIDHHALVTCTLAPRAVPAPRVQAFLVAYYGSERDGQSLDAPMRTVTTRDRLGLVTVEGEAWAITDIGLRMLTPRELARAQGFPDSYQLAEVNGRAVPRTAQVRLVGNSVCPPLAAAVVAANWRLPEAIHVSSTHEDTQICR